MKLAIGTRSILFGVHQFLWHPLTVLLAWRKLYKHWPQWSQLVAIFCHDLGYWGCTNIDGHEGKEHPMRGAMLAARIVGLFRPHPCNYDIHVFYFCLLHSRSVAKLNGKEVSALYAADKVSILYDPKWLYLLRARLSGEIKEFKAHAVREGLLKEGATDGQWYDDYKALVRNRKGIKELL